MTPVSRMVGGCVAAWVAILALVGLRPGLDVLLGMIGPLVAASGTWVMTERTYKRNPTRVTALMVKAFGVKMVFFPAYVAIMLSVVSLQPVPFVVGFTGCFIALLLVEALWLRRLFTGGTRVSA